MAERQDGEDHLAAKGREMRAVADEFLQLRRDQLFRGAAIDAADIETAEIAFLKELPIWQTAVRIDAADETWLAIENLCDLLRDLAPALWGPRS